MKLETTTLKEAVDLSAAHGFSDFLRDQKVEVKEDASPAELREKIEELGFSIVGGVEGDNIVFGIHNEDTDEIADSFIVEVDYKNSMVTKKRMSSLGIKLANKDYQIYKAIKEKEKTNENV